MQIALKYIRRDIRVAVFFVLLQIRGLQDPVLRKSVRDLDILVVGLLVFVNRDRIHIIPDRKSSPALRDLLKRRVKMHDLCIINAALIDLLFQLTRERFRVYDLRSLIERDHRFKITLLLLDRMQFGGVPARDIFDAELKIAGI